MERFDRGGIVKIFIDKITLLSEVELFHKDLHEVEPVHTLAFETGILEKLNELKININNNKENYQKDLNIIDESTEGDNELFNDLFDTTEKALTLLKKQKISCEAAKRQFKLALDKIRSFIKENGLLRISLTLK
ncbi:hypothetical protein RhiirC2_716803 [Rhizophagus irregularis]|uniref:Uncharacterized protein n=1 Tax=Rhizophagus irregularis TaxID=588596 RepID=A0A2N1MPW3_9GLOM|nr:hypothetical protein RhiirC2_716803 [Rhizophagus irregularis]